MGHRPHQHRRQHAAPQRSRIGAATPTTRDDFDPAVEWDGFATDTFDGLGAPHRVVPRRRAHGREHGPRSNGATDVALDAEHLGDVQRAGRRRRRAGTRSRARQRRRTRDAWGGGPTTYTLDPDADFARRRRRARSRSSPRGVADQDGNDPPDSMAADFRFTFTALDAVRASRHADPRRSRAAAPRRRSPGAVTTRGVVVGDYEGPSPGAARLLPPGRSRRRRPGHLRRHLRLQRQRATRVQLGDVVRVTGTAAEFQDQTQISATVDHRSAARAPSRRPT